MSRYEEINETKFIETEDSDPLGSRIVTNDFQVKNGPRDLGVIHFNGAKRGVFAPSGVILSEATLCDITKFLKAEWAKRKAQMPKNLGISY